jgi:hypothetical protein
VASKHIRPHTDFYGSLFSFFHDENTWTKTAFFEITTDTAHGTELVCSFPQCRNGGVKFLFCKFCNDAIARRSFRTQHLHATALSAASTENNETKSNQQQELVSRHEEPMNKPQQKRLKVDHAFTSTAPPACQSDGSNDAVESIRKEWESLLEKRRDYKMDQEVSPWLMEVLTLSERYASQYM